MSQNINMLKKKSDNFFLRNKKFYNPSKKIPYKLDHHWGGQEDLRIIDLIKQNNLKPKSILEIGCATGIKLNQYQESLKTNINYGIDLSSKAINFGKQKYKKLKLLKLSSLEINKINKNFDLIICGFFLYVLDREEIFNQFNLIYKKLTTNGYLIINDFDSLFKHTNTSQHNKNLKYFKMSYSNFLEESGLFKVVYKISYNWKSINDKKKFKCNDTSITLYKKINFINSYPENL
jgi:ubiquinone/menaquinone biosynthesis C-methylase UbiE